MDPQTQKLLAIILAFIFPPLGVLFGNGTTMDFVINLILTLCFWLPGLIHALYVIMTRTAPPPVT